MMTNEAFLESIRESFRTYLRVGTSRSTAKLKSLHGEIALDLEALYGNEFTICSQGYGNDKEGCIEGRYYPKNVDITIYSENRFFVITNVITNFWVNNICLKLGR